MNLVIRGGTVVDTEPIGARAADVLVRDGRVAAVGPDLTAPGAEVIDASGMLVLPGFVDTHRHTWQAGIRAVGPDISFAGYLDLVLNTLAPRYRPTDVHAGTLAGALECLDAGITTVVDWCHIQRTPDHTAAALDALRVAGIRAVFGYCVRNPDVRAARAVRDTTGGLVTMAMAPYGPEIVSEEDALLEWQVARELDLPVTVHMGGHGAESAARGMDFLRRNDLLGPRTSFAHGNSYSDDALREIADSGGTISVSPLVEVELGLGMPVTARAVAAGVPTGLGADTVVSGPGDMFSLMRTAYALARLDTHFTAADALRAATVDGAKAAALDGVGSLKVGNHADVVLLRTDRPGVAPVHDPVASVVLAMDTSAVDTVLVGGRVVKRHGLLRHHDLTALLTTLEESASHVTTT